MCITWRLKTSHENKTLEFILGHGADLKALAFSVDHTDIIDEIFGIPSANFETLITNIEQGPLVTGYSGQDFDSICETKFSPLPAATVELSMHHQIDQSRFGIYLKLFWTKFRFSVKIEFGNRAGRSICIRVRRLSRFCRIHRHSAHQRFNKPRSIFFQLLLLLQVITECSTRSCWNICEAAKSVELKILDPD
ncbi:hypothetical protein CSKR_114078 [Clonorchis sinensis]|uniref:Uncharacterized protein n=1 Tax=Clonorchis sinensis TaxID=79923 RepID=A0A3R7CD51_CLOSI|nr:hypothetical protein CSKR_114078 [Clonorchis sinensis]